MIRTLTLASVLAMLPAAAGAQDATDTPRASTGLPTPAIGLALGQSAPAVQLLRQNGQAAGLTDVMGEKGVAIAFVRSADWCPYCRYFGRTGGNGLAACGNLL